MFIFGTKLLHTQLQTDDLKLVILELVDKHKQLVLVPAFQCVKCLVPLNYHALSFEVQHPDSVVDISEKVVTFDGQPDDSDSVFDGVVEFDFEEKFDS